MKKLLTMLLALVMVLSVTTLSWADGTALPDAENGVITLTENVTLSSWNEIEQALTLDLNGCTLTANCQPKVGDNGILTIKDSGENGKLVLAAGGIMLNEGKLILNGGTIHKDAGGNVFLMGAAQFEMNGGSLTANSSACIDATYCSTDDKIAKLTITAGVIETGATNTCAIYIAGRGILGGANTGNVQAEISGGTVKSAGDDAVLVDGIHSALTVSGGTFVGAVRRSNTDGNISVAGGTFSTDVSSYVTTAPVAKRTNGSYIVGASAIVAAANADGSITIVKSNGAVLEGVNSNVTVSAGENAGTVTVNGNTVDSGESYTVPQPPRYYYNSTTTTTDTKADGTKGSPKTFDAGMGIYALTAVLSVTGMAYVGKKKF